MSKGMLLFFFFVALLAHAGFVRPEELQPKNIFILAGQSNMAGRGGLITDPKTKALKWDGKIPPQSNPNTNILQLDLNKTWVQAHEPLHVQVDYGKTCGIGPGIPFANAILAKNPSYGAIGLVPCAKGGTSIKQWARGTEYYNRLVDRAKAAMQCGGKLQALLWYQGETDTKEKRDAKLYKLRLVKFILDVRRDLNSPHLPIILVAIASAEGPFIDIVRNAQLNIHLKNVKCIDAMGSHFLQDNLHLNTESEIHISQLFADTFLSCSCH
ncbi:probable carbohydrate esterase At4g34215 [Fagus crenata]